MTKLLYVEDEPFLAKIVKESLESRNYIVRHESDGYKVLNAFQNFKPEICILDVMLPNKDGFKIAEEIRALDANIPIIFLTAKDQIDDVVKGFTLGGNDYLKKPFSIEELILRVNNLLTLAKASKVNKVTEVVFAGFIFNSDEMSLKHEDKSFVLSHKENEILKILVSNRNQKIERSKILYEVWGNDSYFNSRTLDVYVRKIRSMLAIDPRVKILTLRGIGYNFYVEA